ncbi:MAG TPA: thioredoxin family protein [Bacteroidales bacterium]|nr:thioredoxin family protein [Bacteroidales bacterium]
MKTIIWFSLLIFSTGIAACGQEINKRIMDPRFGTEVMVGYCDREGLQGDEEFGLSFNDEYSSYETDDATMKEIRRHRKGIDIVLVLGSWCSDSQEQVPRFFRILDDAHIKEKSMTIICVDGKKQCSDIDMTPYGIEFVPTIIFYRKGTEIGRIVETPTNTLESDMLNIIG